MLEKNDISKKKNFGVVRGLDNFKANDILVEQENMRITLIRDIKNGKIKKQPL